MKTRSRAKFVMVVVCVAALGPFAGVLQALAFGEGDGPIIPGLTSVGPPLVRLTGTVLAPGEHARREGLEVLNVRAGDKELMFKLERAEDLTGERTGEELLQDLAGGRLFLRGPEKLIRPLEGPKTVGKRMHIEGSLFVSDRILEVTAIGADAAKAG